MYVVVAYDVSDDRRRAKLYEFLLGFGSPVQRSVFECDVTADQLTTIRRKAARIVRQSGDSVRYYTLCRMCQRRTQLSGTPLLMTHSADYVV